MRRVAREERDTPEGPTADPHPAGPSYPSICPETRRCGLNGQGGFWDDGSMTLTARVVWIALALLLALFVIGGLMTLMIQPG